MAIGAVGAGILQGLGQVGMNAVGGAISYAFQKRLAEQQNRYNRELMQYQQQLQQESIDKQNEYNTPAMQMQRFAEAGLNPNLIYGQGNNGNQTAVPKPTSQAPADYQRNNAFNNMLQGVSMLDNMIKIQKSINETKESAARARMMENQAFLTDVNTRLGRWKYNNMLPLYREEQMLRNTGLGYDNEINRWRARYADDNALSNKILNEYNADISYLQYQRELSEYSFWSLWNKKKLDMFDIEYLHKKQAYWNMVAQNDILQLQKTNQELQNDWDKWHNQYRSKYGKNLYTPHFPTENYGNQLQRRFENETYLDYGF